MGLTAERIGEEARAQMLAAEGRLPDLCVAAVGGGSNAIGLFHPFLDDPVELVGVEAAGHGIASGEHAASIAGGLVYALVTLAFAIGLREPGTLGSAEPRPNPLPARRLLVMGLAAAGLPWLSSKFAPLSAVLVAIGVVRCVVAGAGTTGRGRALAGLLGPYTLSLAAWFTFFVVLWGSPWPSAAYGEIGRAHV